MLISFLFPLKYSPNWAPPLPLLRFNQGLQCFVCFCCLQQWHMVGQFGQNQWKYFPGEVEESDTLNERFNPSSISPSSNPTCRDWPRKGYVAVWCGRSNQVDLNTCLVAWKPTEVIHKHAGNPSQSWTYSKCPFERGNEWILFRANLANTFVVLMCTSFSTLFNTIAWMMAAGNIQ